MAKVSNVTEPSLASYRSIPPCNARSGHCDWLLICLVLQDDQCCLHKSDVIHKRRKRNCGLLYILSEKGQTVAKSNNFGVWYLNKFCDSFSGPSSLC